MQLAPHVAPVAALVGGTLEPMGAPSVPAVPAPWRRPEYRDRIARRFGPRRMLTDLKCAASSLLGTIVDYGLVLVLVELASLFYVAAVALGAAAGAVCSFLLHHRWAYRAQSAARDTAGSLAVAASGVRFFVVAGVALALSSLSVWVLTAGFGLFYIASKLLSSVALFLCWTLPANRRFVFKP